MPLFPKHEAAIEELAMEMVSGFEANPGLFPHADVAYGGGCALRWGAVTMGNRLEKT